MPNTFLDTKIIARQALPRLIENLVMPNLCFRDFSEEFSDKGNTVRVRKPTVLVAQDFDSSSGTTPQDIKESSVDVTLNRIATVDLSIEAVQMALNIDDLNARVIEPAAVALAQKINAEGLKTYTQFAAIGTAGTTPDGLDDLANARLALNLNNVPTTGRVAVWDPQADAKFTQISNLTKVSEAGTPNALREGEIGRIYGLNNYMCQAVQKHTAGATGTVLVDGAATKGSNTLHVDGVTTAFKVGDHFTIANDTTLYTVIAAKALETADQDLTIFPALAKNAADNAAITVGSGYTANMVFHPNAIAFVTRPLIPPKGVESYTTSYNGISLRVVHGYDMTHKRTLLSIDVLYDYAVIYPEMGVVYMG